MWCSKMQLEHILGSRWPHRTSAQQHNLKGDLAASFDATQLAGVNWMCIPISIRFWSIWDSWDGHYWMWCFYQHLMLRTGSKRSKLMFQNGHNRLLLPICQVLLKCVWPNWGNSKVFDPCRTHVLGMLDAIDHQQPLCGVVKPQRRWHQKLTNISKGPFVLKGHYDKYMASNGWNGWFSTTLDSCASRSLIIDWSKKTWHWSDCRNHGLAIPMCIRHTYMYMYIICITYIYTCMYTCTMDLDVI